MAVSNVADLVDTSTFHDDGSIGLTGRPISGVRVVLEWCARAIFTTRGSMRWARTKGRSLRALENGDFSPAELSRARSTLNAELQKVDFVIGVQSTLTQDPAGNITFAASITVAGSGVYPLAVSISHAGAAIANFGGVQ